MVTGGLSQEGEEGVTFTSHLEKVCDPMDYNPSGSSLHGILQARILELPFPPPADLPNPGIKLGPPALQAGSLPLHQLGSPFMKY